jgi:hypothetical protein
LRNALQKTFERDGGSWLTSQERKTHWLNAIHDLGSHERLRKFLCVLLNQFRNVFEPELRARKAFP